MAGGGQIRLLGTAGLGTVSQRGHSWGSSRGPEGGGEQGFKGTEWVNLEGPVWGLPLAPPPLCDLVC